MEKKYAELSIKHWIEIYRREKTKHVFLAGILILYVSYWLLTFLFTFPDTSVVVLENNKGYSIFENLLYQRWSFFAPPPTSNSEMTYAYLFIDKNHKLRKVEIKIFENLKQKSLSHFPFNEVYSNEMWSLFQQSEYIFATIRDYDNYIYGRKLSDRNFEISEKTKNQNLYKVIENSEAMNFLVNHANNLRESLSIPQEAIFQVKFQLKAIPKYADRNNKKRDEANLSTIFISNTYNFKLRKWID